MPPPPGLGLTVRQKPGSTSRVIATSTNPTFLVKTGAVAGNESSFNVTLAGHAPVGLHSGQVRLTTGREEEAVLIPVAAEVVPPIAISPVVVRLRPTEGVGARMASFFVHRVDGSPLGRLNRIEAPDGLTVEELSGDGEKLRRFRARSAALKAPIADSKITLHFAREAEPIIVHVAMP